MKRIVWYVAVITVLACNMSVSAQILNTSDARKNWQVETDLLRTDLRTQKQEIVAKNMGLTQAEAAKFWPIYQEYEAELQVIWNERMTLVEEYGRVYANATDEQAATLIERSLDLDSNMAELRETYYRKFKKALSATIAARFVQIDRRINSVVELQVSNSLPLVK